MESREKRKKGLRAHTSEKISLLYADKKGRIFDLQGTKALARLGVSYQVLSPEDLIPLPKGADLMFLPKRSPLLKMPSGEIVQTEGEAVAAILPQGYTRTFLPAFFAKKDAPPLPLYGYTAVALYHDEIHVAAVLTDENEKWNPLHYNTKDLPNLIEQVQKKFPHNRLVSHLANCSLSWHCLTAQNLFYHRFEAAVPLSPTCNASCLGCISLQENKGVLAPQNRLSFLPKVEEVLEIGIYHLQTAKDAIISFGQGCEGEPSLQADIIAKSIKCIRKKTCRGQININTNAGYTEGIKKIVDAGLDSMRVSIISADEENYALYYRPSYTLAKVQESISYALAKGVHVSLNMLYLPGFNDRTEEIKKWISFLQKCPVNMVQIRNLNIDPDVFFTIMPKERKKPVGTRAFLQILKTKFPLLKIGNFSHYIFSS